MHHLAHVRRDREPLGLEQLHLAPAGRPSLVADAGAGRRLDFGPESIEIRPVRVGVGVDPPRDGNGGLAGGLRGQEGLAERAQGVVSSAASSVTLLPLGSGRTRRSKSTSGPSKSSCQISNANAGGTR